MSTLDDQERRRRCFWCGRPGAATKDHVFPRGLFPEPMPEGVTPITVPACRQHNGAFNLDEEYFRDFVVGAAYEHPEARQIWDVRTVSALEKKPKYRALLASQLQDFEVRSDTGLYLGTGSMMHADPRRIELVLRKIVTGLVFRESGNVLGFPAFYFQQILKNDDLAPWRSLLPSLEVRRLGHIVYRFGQAVDEPRGVVGLFMFFDRVLFATCTFPRDPDVPDPLQARKGRERLRRSWTPNS